jgi:hypothetical protein
MAAAGSTGTSTSCSAPRFVPHHSSPRSLFRCAASPPPTSRCYRAVLLRHTPRLRSQQHSKPRRQPHTTQRSFNSSPPAPQPTPSLLPTSIGEFSDRFPSWVFVSGRQSWQPSSRVLRVWRRVFWLFLGFFVGLAKPSPWVAIISHMGNA